MKLKKNILLTFDYELFLGNISGSAENCLLKPTEKLLEILKQNKSQAIFFIDTTYIKRLSTLAKSNIKAEKDFENISKQLVQICSLGHYIFHHIHPHWLDAKYLEEINQWDLSNIDRFVWNCLNEKEKSEIFDFSFHFLTEIAERAGSEKPINGFRAGGCFIEPFSEIIEQFEQYGIAYEFSVLPGEKRKGDLLFYDFTNCPANQPYFFTNSITKQEDKGKFIEFPISKIQISGISKITNSIYYRTKKNNSNNKHFGDGLSVGKEINKNREHKRGLKKYLSFELPISVELLNPTLLRLYKNKLKNDDYVHFLSHPKLLSHSSLNNFNTLLSFYNSNYCVEYDFKKFIL